MVCFHNRNWLWFLLFGTGLFFCGNLCAEEPLKELLAKLEADDFAGREESQKKIRAMGTTVLPDLHLSAIKARTPELRTRLETLINDIEKDAAMAKANANRARANFQTYPVGDLLRSFPSSSTPSLGFGEGYGIGTRYWDSGGLGGGNNPPDSRLIAAVKAMIEPGSWEDGRNSIAVLQNSLVVNATPETQQRVAALLQSIRAAEQSQIEIHCVLLQPKNPIEQRALSIDEFDALLKNEAKESVLLRSRIVGANYTPTAVVEGRQFEYIPETIVAATEGGGIVGGVRAQQCLDGYALSLLPRWDSTKNETALTITFYRNINLSMRKLNANEKWILERNEVVGKTEKGATNMVKQSAGPNEEKKPWAYPNADLQSLHTNVIIPKGQWVIAGQLTGVKNDEKPIVPGLMYLLVKAEGIKAKE